MSNQKSESLAEILSRDWSYYQTSKSFAEMASLFLAEYSGLPSEQMGGMCAPLGLTTGARMDLTDPQLKVVIVVEPCIGVEPQSLEHFQAAKRERPDVPFVVLVTSEEEADCLLFREAGAEYVVHTWVKPDEIIAELAKIGAELARKTS